MNEEERGGRRRKEEGVAGTFPFAVNRVTRDHQQLVLPLVLPDVLAKH
jgi:hypothetical protein